MDRLESGPLNSSMTDTANTTILVIGSTGKTGNRVATELQKRGIRVRHGSRCADIPFDWDNRQTWAAALAGVVMASGLAWTVVRYAFFAQHFNEGAEQPDRVAEAFAEDAVFQGLRPYSVGRQGVVDYYASQPRGMTVTYRILETRSPAAELVVGYVSADFAFPDRPTVSANIGVVIAHGGGGWRILQYQASRAA
jgi:hypothetical protein